MAATPSTGTAAPPAGDATDPAFAQGNPFKTDAGTGGQEMIAGLPIPLPEGWTSEFDEESKAWYFVGFPRYRAVALLGGLPYIRRSERHFLSLSPFPDR